MLPARDGFPRKVKPLVRLAERETAAYCILRGIDYEVEECPMAVGNKHLGYKEALNAIEATSPGSKQQFYFGFLERVVGRSSPPTTTRGVALRPASAAVRRPRATSARSAGWPNEPHRPSPWSPGPEGDPLTDGRPLRAGEQVLLIDGKDRRYLVRLEDGGEFHTHAGILPHDDIIGGDEGAAAEGQLRRRATGSSARRSPTSS